MRKTTAYFLVFWIFIFSQFPAARAASEMSTAKKISAVEVRGFVNLLSSPSELVASSLREFKRRKLIGVITFVPQSGSNFIYRVVSAVNDILLHPCTAPFTDNITPWTEYMGLPEYPWRTE
jgi:hypothetical protein